MVKSGGTSLTRGPVMDTSPQALHELAVAAVIWGTPIVSVDAMRLAFLRDAGAQDGDVVYLSKPADWRFQITTPNASTNYAFTSLYLREPTVVEIPPAEGAGIFGSFNDAWQVPLVDFGPQGEDRGTGARYVLLPPGDHTTVPSGYIAVHVPTRNVYSAMRAIPAGNTPDDVQRAIDLIKRIQIFPLSTVESPPTTRFIDTSAKLFDGIVRFDETFFTSLARMIEVEPALARDKPILERLAALGIRKGSPFTPGPGIRAVLDRAARDAHARFVRDVSKVANKLWSSSHWSLPDLTGARTNFTYAESGGGIDLEARALMFFLACAPPAKIGKASVYLTNYKDATGLLLSGDKTYRLRVPANVPARQFWAATIYDAETAGFIRDAKRVEVSSYDREVQKHGDGSVDIYFAPNPVPGHAANTIATNGRPWFTLFRLYGPEANFDKTWQLPDIELMR